MAIALSEGLIVSLRWFFCGGQPAGDHPL